MKSIIGVISRLLHRVRMYRRNQAMLVELRAANPSCRILSIPSRSVSIGENSAILDGVYLEQVSLGNCSYISSNSRLVNVNIGNFCSIGQDVQVGLAPHPSRVFVSTYPAFYSNFNEGCPLNLRESKIFDDTVPETAIGNDVWIGSNVIIPGGIRIGTGAIIAAGAVVVKDVPPYAVVGGNPATIIRYRFTEEQIISLLESEWWNWPSEKIRQHIDDFSDVEKLLKSLTL